jgi:phosphoglycerate dehydrogenase-like enzyme
MIARQQARSPREEDSVASPNGRKLTPVVSGPALTTGQKAQLASAGAVVIADGVAEPSGSAEPSAAQLAEAEAWLGGGLTAERLTLARHLRWLHAPGAGVDHYLFPELIQSEVTVTSIRRRHAVAADHAMALILALARGLPALVRQQQRRSWRPPSPSEMVPISGTKVIIVGTGQVGSGLAVRAAAFGATPVGINRSGQTPGCFAQVFPSAELGRAVRGARWVVSCCPLTPESAGMFSAEIFARMERTTNFVNVGRGGTVDQQALISALRGQIIAAAALDVFAGEPLPADSELWTMPNVLITPHSGGVIADVDGVQLGVDSFLENLAQYRRGEALADAVDKARGY